MMISEQTLITMYCVRRLFTAIDEWGLYIMLFLLYKFGMPWWIIGIVTIHGTLAIITAYKNLDIIEGMLGVKTMLYWPLL